MKNMVNFNKISITVLAIALVFALVGPTPTIAATNPSLGAVANFSILAQTAITGISTISGDVGMNSSGASITALTTGNVAGTIYATDLAAPSEALLLPAVQANASTVYTATIPGLPIEGTPIVGGVLNGVTRGPGVYDLGAGTLSGGVLTLDGPGTYIFRTTTTLVSSGSINFINGARACDLFWNVGTAATINGTSFAGTILAGTGVHFGAGVALDGRALAVGGDVTLGVGGSISGPSCAAPASSSSSSLANNNITVVKQVINDNGGTAVYSDFPLFINGNPVTSGASMAFAPGIYTVTETTRPGYTTAFTGNCDANGRIDHGGISTHHDFCTVVNDDIGAPAIAPIPPLIDVVKVPNPLALPAGPGSVTYTYTVKNIGTVPMTGITMVGDTCSPIVLNSGDIDGDSQLDVSETWIYGCSKTLTQTTTNTVVATGHANGLTAIDVASATVVVGTPIIPPLIHVTKVPNPLTLLAGAGKITYEEKITNPGTVALSNVRLTDDKCTVKFDSGDTNRDAKLDTDETWTFFCASNLTQTTTNTATAIGEANGLIATDFATATVVVAVPRLPNTGVGLDEKGILWNIVLSLGLFAVSGVLFSLARRKRTA